MTSNAMSGVPSPHVGALMRPHAWVMITPALPGDKLWMVCTSLYRCRLKWRLVWNKWPRSVNARYWKLPNSSGLRAQIFSKNNSHLLPHLNYFSNTYLQNKPNLEPFGKSNFREKSSVRICIVHCSMDSISFWNIDITLFSCNKMLHIHCTS